MFPKTHEKLKTQAKFWKKLKPEFQKISKTGNFSWVELAENCPKKAWICKDSNCNFRAGVACDGPSRWGESEQSFQVNASHRKRLCTESRATTERVHEIYPLQIFKAVSGWPLHGLLLWDLFLRWLELPQLCDRGAEGAKQKPSPGHLHLNATHYNHLLPGKPCLLHCASANRDPGIKVSILLSCFLLKQVFFEHFLTKLYQQAVIATTLSSFLVFFSLKEAIQSTTGLAEKTVRPFCPLKRSSTRNQYIKLAHIPVSLKMVGFFWTICLLINR